MNESTRARVASVLAAAIKGGRSSSVFDHSAGQHRISSTRVNDGRVQGFDHGSGTHISGSSSSPTKLDFYDHETSSHVQLKHEGNRFSGYDHHTASHFSGTISGSTITLYDHQTGQYYYFNA